MTLREKLQSIYSAIDHIEKGGTNKAQNYKYMKAADVVRTLRAQFIEHKIYAEVNYDFVGGPFTIAREKAPNAPFAAVNVKCLIVFHDLESTETLTSSGVGTGCDNNDKAAYKAMTGALKYALKNAFLIPDEADPEGDESVDDAGSQSTVYMDEDMPDFRDAARGNPTPKQGKPPEKNAVKTETKTVGRPTQAPAAQQAEASGATSAAGNPADVSKAPKQNSSTTATQQTVAPSNSAQPAAEASGTTTSSTTVQKPAPNAGEGPLPTEEELAAFSKTFRKLSDDLSANGKLKSSKGLPVNRKCIVFLLERTNTTDVKHITVPQWEDFFARVNTLLAQENGLINLGVLVNRANGIETKK
jgi:hypothetical protein